MSAERPRSAVALVLERREGIIEVRRFASRLGAIAHLHRGPASDWAPFVRAVLYEDGTPVFTMARTADGWHDELEANEPG